MPNQIPDDGSTLLLSSVNSIADIVFDQNVFYLTDPLPASNPDYKRNTVVKLIPYAVSSYYGTRTIYYDRIDLSALTLLVYQGLATTIDELLPAINLKYSLHIGVDEVENLSIASISHQVLLKAKFNSYGYINQTNVLLANDVPPSLASFSITPGSAQVNEVVKIQFNAINLKSSTRYIGYIYYEPDGVAYDGTIYYKTVEITSSDIGTLSYSADYVTPFTFNGVKVFLFIAEATNVIPDTVTPAGVYSEILRSQGIALGVKVPNTYFTSTLYGVVFEESISISTSNLYAGGLVVIPNEAMTIGRASIDSGTLSETIVYVSFSFAEQSQLIAGIASIDFGTLFETIVYKSALVDEASKLQIGISSVESGKLDVVISYLSYTTIETSKLNVGLSTITSGTLT